MKREVPPAAAAAVIVVFLLAVGVFIYLKTSRGSGNPAEIERIIQAGVVKSAPGQQSGPAQGVMPGSSAPPLTTTIPGAPPR